MINQENPKNPESKLEIRRKFEIAGLKYSRDNNVCDIPSDVGFHRSIIEFMLSQVKSKTK